jgi:hypothetical protein
MQAIELLKRILKHYSIDINPCVCVYACSLCLCPRPTHASQCHSRKVALASAGLVYYYITRVVKIGFIDWRDPYDKIYSIVLLLYIGLVFALG